MASIPRAYCQYSQDAVLLLGSLIRAARKERRWTAQQLAERAGISRGMLHRIEKGDLRCAIGSVFELAAILGINLFDADGTAMTKLLNQTKEKLTLLPRSIRKRKIEFDDDF